QFVDYAGRQRAEHSQWLDEHVGYWRDRLGGCRRLRFPEECDAQAPVRSGWGIVPLRIGGDLRRLLNQWSKSQRTTLVISVFTAYIALVLRWCGTSEAVFQFQSDGRDPETVNTIGCFTSVLYLRVALHEEDRFADLLQRVTQEYCSAYEHADSAYLAT